MKRLFYPESIAVIGASPRIGGGKIPYYQILRGLGFKGALYPVNPSYKEIDGAEVYAGIDDLPNGVDLAIASVPAAAALDTVKAASRKGVGYLHFFTSGFSEIGKSGLEEDLLMAKGNTRILGPNCIGVHCTESRVFFDPFFRQSGVGRAAFLGQSGAVTSNFVRMAQSRHIPINKVVSYGNQIDIKVEELLEYLAQDETITAIGAYIEDVKDGRRFFEALKMATSRKPVVILKGGRTDEGAKAASSHTGALAGSYEIWSAVMKQLRCIEVDTFEQMIDVMMLATSYKMPTGHRVGFLGAGGGTSVLFTDLAYAHGLTLPVLDQKTQDGISKKIRNINTCTLNPVDLGAYGFDFNIMAHTMKEMDSDPNIDVIIPYFSIDFITTFQPEQIESGPHTIANAARDIVKPVIPIFSKFTEDSIKIEEARIRICAIFKEAGLAVFNNIQDCIFSLRELLDWSENS